MLNSAWGEQLLRVECSNPEERFKFLATAFNKVYLYLRVVAKDYYGACPLALMSWTCVELW